MQSINMRVKKSKLGQIKLIEYGHLFGVHTFVEALYVNCTCEICSIYLTNIWNINSLAHHAGGCFRSSCLLF